ncbi:hypothetical protein THIOSC15_1180001 [uncultured Thiomicrorhabdus sp.]
MERERRDEGSFGINVVESTHFGISGPKCALWRVDNQRTLENQVAWLQCIPLWGWVRVWVFNFLLTFN